MGGRELTDKDFRELEVLAIGSVADTDYIPVYDASADEVKKLAFAQINANTAAISALTGDGSLATVTSLNHTEILTEIVARFNAIGA